ncbi:hypothetical protein NPIL_82331 [Nephila pilipes]|uniref:Uncharacterized protein n=1 Tax=Nephila pilipes TaxID=299642 RepID=A0A8X6R0U6_NEPPI|nr:hypothetical protein NPIL_82331 [Nephila pilipes]
MNERPSGMEKCLQSLHAPPRKDPVSAEHTLRHSAPAVVLKRWNTCSEMAWQHDLQMRRNQGMKMSNSGLINSAVHSEVEILGFGLP